MATKAELEARIEALEAQVEALTMVGGPIEMGVRMAVSEVADVEGFDLALAAVAVRLASQLDEGMGLATAGVSKELRATIESIRERAAGDDADADPVAELDAELDGLSPG